MSFSLCPYHTQSTLPVDRNTRTNTTLHEIDSLSSLPFSFVNMFSVYVLCEISRLRALGLIANAHNAAQEKVCSKEKQGKNNKINCVKS